MTDDTGAIRARWARRWKERAKHHRKNYLFQLRLWTAAISDNVRHMERAERAEADSATWLAIVREAARQLEWGADRTEIQSALYDAVRRVEEVGAPGAALLADREALLSAARSYVAGPDAAGYERLRAAVEQIEEGGSDVRRPSPDRQ